jgi:hypothetical protein
MVHTIGMAMILATVSGENDGKARAVVGPEEQAVEPVLDVIGGPKVRVGFAHAVEDASKGAVKLHPPKSKGWAPKRTTGCLDVPILSAAESKSVGVHCGRQQRVGQVKLGNRKLI